MSYLFVSDIHLGSNVSSAQNNELERRFISWLEAAHRERAVIFLLGDIFDFWFEYKRVVPAAHSMVLGQLKKMTQDGIEIHFFKGNHDMWLRSYLKDDVGLIIHDRSEIVNIDGRNVMIGHGHDLCFRRTIMTRLLWILFNTKFFYNFFSAILHPNFMMSIGEKWSKSSRKKKCISHQFKGDDEYIAKHINESLEEYKKKGVTEFIFGHFHCPTLYTLKDGVSKLVILGEWSSENPIYAEIRNGVLLIKD